MTSAGTAPDNQSLRGRPSLEDTRRPSSNASIHYNGTGGRPSLSSPTHEASETASLSALGFGSAPGAGAVPVQFDEGVLRQLCDLDVSAEPVWPEARSLTPAVVPAPLPSAPCRCSTAG